MMCIRKRTGIESVNSLTRLHGVVLNSEQRQLHSLKYKRLTCNNPLFLSVNSMVHDTKLIVMKAYKYVPCW
jgi:hypothetical protein